MTRIDREISNNIDNIPCTSRKIYIKKIRILKYTDKKLSLRIANIP